MMKNEIIKILIDYGVEGNEYGDLVEYLSNLLAEIKWLSEVNDVLQSDLEQFIEKSAEDEAGLKDELKATEAEVLRLREAIADIANDMVENLPDNLTVYVSKLRKVIE